MFNLIQLYLNNNINGVQIGEIQTYIEKNISDNYFTNGFWLGNSYYTCIKDVFTDKNNTRIKKSAKCVDVMHLLDCNHCSPESYNCFKCLKECIDNFQSTASTIKLKEH